MVDERLIPAARAVLAEHGLPAFTVERVAAAAGMSRMTLHRHGIGKPEILAALFEQFLEDERAALWKPMTADGSAAVRLRAVLERRCEIAERHLDVVAAMDIAARNAAFHGPDGLTRPEFVEPLRRLLVDGEADGSLRSADPDEDATLLYNLVGHTYRHMRTGHGWSPRRARDAVLRLAFDGIRAR
jgi:AcrR family transcriptional regulator